MEPTADDLNGADVLEQMQVLRAQTGDTEAYCLLFRKYNRKLLYYLRRLLDEPADADDVLQDVWLSVLRQIGKLKEPRAFRTWLYRIARNHAISRLRKKRKTGNLTQAEEVELVDDVESVDDDVIQQYSAASVHQALGKLGARHRDVLTLRFLEQLSYDEIANIVDCSVGTIRSRIHYAKKKLKEILTNHEKRG